MNGNDGRRNPGGQSKYGIPFRYGTIEYSRAVYLCRKYRKSYEEAMKMAADEDREKIEVRVTL